MSHPAQPLDSYAVIGYPVAQSWSPFIHGLFAKQTQQSLTYTRLETPPERFEAEAAAFFARGGKGLNVTAPHKQAAAALAGERTQRAEVAGAVNTLAARRDGILGDNTAGAGLESMLSYHWWRTPENTVPIYRVA